MQGFLAVKIPLLFLCLFILVLPISSHGSTEKQGQSLVQEAESFFKIGYVFHKQGLHEMATVAFEKSRALLLKASAQGDVALQKQIHALFKNPVKNTPSQPVNLGEAFKSNYRLGSLALSSSVHKAHIQSHIHRLTTENKSFLKNSFRKSQKFIAMIRKEFARHGIPLELAYTALIESGFNTHALSHAGARGIWQFIPSTARIYGLEVSEKRDDRLDPFKSTQAAAQYLQKLYRQFKSWPLALAAYNCGENRVASAMKKYNAKTFWELLRHNALPKETQKYVPSVIAVAIISKDLPLYGINTQ